MEKSKVEEKPRETQTIFVDGAITFTPFKSAVIEWHRRRMT